MGVEYRLYIIGTTYLLRIAAYVDIEERRAEGCAERGGHIDSIRIIVAQINRIHAVLANACADPLFGQQGLQGLNDGIIVASALLKGQVVPPGVVKNLGVVIVAVLGINIVGTKGNCKVDSTDTIPILGNHISRKRIAVSINHRGGINVADANPDALPERAGGRILVVKGLIEEEIVSLLESKVVLVLQLHDVVHVGHLAQGLTDGVSHYNRLRGGVAISGGVVCS